MVSYHRLNHRYNSKVKVFKTFTEDVASRDSQSDYSKEKRLRKEAREL